MYSEYEVLEGACSEPENPVRPFHYKGELGKLSVICTAIRAEEGFRLEPTANATPEELRDSLCWNCTLNPRTREEIKTNPFN